VLRDFLLDLLQAADDPAVGLGEVEMGGVAGIRSRFYVGREAAVLPFAVHQHEARGVPQLVAEVAVTLAALHVELDVATRRGEARER
jgi:hypothetical protein